MYILNFMRRSAIAIDARALTHTHNTHTSHAPHIYHPRDTIVSCIECLHDARGSRGHPDVGPMPILDVR